jgi:hypothetical protein
VCASSSNARQRKHGRHETPNRPIKPTPSKCHHRRPLVDIGSSPGARTAVHFDEDVLHHTRCARGREQTEKTEKPSREMAVSKGVSQVCG